MVDLVFKKSFVPLGGASVKDLSGRQIQQAASLQGGECIFGNNAVGMADPIASHFNGWKT